MPRARVAYWYPGLNATTQPESVITALNALLPELHLEREISQRLAQSKLTATRVRKLVLGLTGDRKQADKEAATFLLNEEKNAARSRRPIRPTNNR